MKKLKSFYTVDLVDMLTDLENNCFFLVTHLEENGNLEAFLSDKPNFINSQIITMFIEVLRGLVFLKANRIIHSNLNP